MIELLIDRLQRLGLEPTAEEVADLLWLAERLPAPPKQRKRRANDKRNQEPPPTTPNKPINPVKPSVPPDRRERLLTVSSERERTTTSQPSTTQLFPMQAASEKQKGIAASVFRSAAAYALPAPLELGRSLRPLNRRTSSRIHTIVDIPATVDRMAETALLFAQQRGYWTPITKPALERWFNLSLLVDESSSMGVWENTIHEFVILLERQGAFAEIQLWGFRSDPNADPNHATVLLYSGIGSTAQRDRLRRPGELLDETGQRLTLVLSDCVAPIWHNGAAAKLLMGLGSQGRLALVQMLPERMWHRTGLRNFPSVHLRAQVPGMPNHDLDTLWTSDWFDPPVKHLPVPVVTLEAEWLGRWAKSLAGNSGLWIPGVLLNQETSGAVPSQQQLSAADLVRTFYATATPLARQLAIYLACAPLTLPVMRMVQRVMVPEARQIHLAEVLASGLIVRPTLTTTYQPADSWQFAFVQGVRELLQSNLRAHEMRQVMSALTTYVAEKTNRQLFDFAALLADRSAEGTLHIDETYQPFAEVAVPLLRSFGDRYARAADWLEQNALKHDSSKTGTEQRIEGEPKGQRRLQREAKSDSPQTIYALIVGIDHYQDRSVTTLQNSVADALRAQEWMATRFEVKHLTTLLDDKASKRAIIDAWQAVANSVNEGDHLFFHYTGFDQGLATDDPNEGDGLEETLFVHDSIAGKRESLLTYRELIGLVDAVEAKGAQVVLFLDTCHAGGSSLCRRAQSDTLIIASSHESEQSTDGGSQSDTPSAAYWLAEAMKQSKPGVTWAEIFDFIFVNVKRRYPKQTPQLIGPRDLCVFSNKRNAVEPYLLVTQVAGNEVSIHAHEALLLQPDEPGPRLWLYPPGSDLRGTPLTSVTATQYQSEQVVTVGVELPTTLVPGCRALIGDYGYVEQNNRLMVEWDETIVDLAKHSELYFLQPRREIQSAYQSQPAPSQATLQVHLTDEHFQIESATGSTLWREEPSTTGTLQERAEQVHRLLEQIVHYWRTLNLTNPEAFPSHFADAVELEVTAIAAGEGTILAGQPAQLFVRNRSDVDLYLSVWMFDDHLGVQRIFPVQTECTLLGKGRTAQLTVTLQMNDAEKIEESITFKVFATQQPADLDILHLPRLSQSVDLSGLEEVMPQRVQPPVRPTTTQRPARKTAQKEQRSAYTQTNEAWNPGGQVAVRDKLWQNGQTIRVRFLDGDRSLWQRIQGVMEQWTEHANLHFAFGDDPDAEIRISFKEKGAWTSVGTDCLSVSKDKPTMNFGWLRSNTSQLEVQRVVLGETGEALGLTRCHRSPIANIPWNREKVYQYYVGPPNNWSRQTVDQLIFQQYSDNECISAAADPKSIMQYPIPKELLREPAFEVGMNMALSPGDKAFIALVYPK